MEADGVDFEDEVFFVFRKYEGAGVFPSIEYWFFFTFWGLFESIAFGLGHFFSPGFDGFLVFDGFDFGEEAVVGDIGEVIRVVLFKEILIAVVVGGPEEFACNAAAVDDREGAFWWLDVDFLDIKEVGDVIF